MGQVLRLHRRGLRGRIGRRWSRLDFGGPHGAPTTNPALLGEAIVRRLVVVHLVDRGGYAELQ